MSEKRFKFADGYSLRYNCIIDNLKGEDNDIHNVLKTDEVLDMLNKFHEEDITLKSELYFSQNQNRELIKVLKDNRSMAEVVEENKELKQFKQLVFDLIDKKINEMEKEYKFGQEVYKGCPMHNIRYGINTLKELREDLS